MPASHARKPWSPPALRRWYVAPRFADYRTYGAWLYEGKARLAKARGLAALAGHAKALRAAGKWPRSVAAETAARAARRDHDAS